MYEWVYGYSLYNYFNLSVCLKFIKIKCWVVKEKNKTPILFLIRMLDQKIITGFRVVQRARLGPCSLSGTRSP